MSFFRIKREMRESIFGMLTNKWKDRKGLKIAFPLRIDETISGKLCTFQCHLRNQVNGLYAFCWVVLSKFYMGYVFVGPSHGMRLLKKCKLFIYHCSSCCSFHSTQHVHFTWWLWSKCNWCMFSSDFISFIIF